MTGMRYRAVARRTARLQVRMTLADVRFVRRGARADGQTVAGYVRCAIRRYAVSRAGDRKSCGEKGASKRTR
jgi:hypothetical protein